MKILVVDDNDSFRESLCSLLNSIGFSTVSATNGAEAAIYLEKCEGSKASYPSLILLDMNMPIMNGLEFLNLKSKKNWNIPSLILTAQEHFGPISEPYLAKPFKFELLLQKIKELTEFPHL